MQSQQKAGLSLSLSLFLPSLGFTDRHSEAEGEEIREEGGVQKGRKAE